MIGNQRSQVTEPIQPSKAIRDQEKIHLPTFCLQYFSNMAVYFVGITSTDSWSRLPCFGIMVTAYVQACQDRGYSRVTQEHYRKGSEKFLSFLESKGLSTCAQITAQHCAAYLETWLGYQPKTVELQLCALRSFLRYLHATGQHDRDLTRTLPSVRVSRQARIPSAWTVDQVRQVLEVIDRGNPAVKRDYAMILLVARLGLRTMDVKHLKLQHLHWANHRIDMVTSKTGQRLSLPLLPDVGWAIIDYLKNGRPQADSPYVFLRHLAPLEPFTDDDHLHQVLEKYRLMAHVPLPLRVQCVNGKGPRSITVRGDEAKMQERRQEQASEEWQAHYCERRRVEHVNEQLTARGGRQGRYIGERKTRENGAKWYQNMINQLEQ